MTNEQWLVYLWSIYPNGEYTALWVGCLCLVMIFLLIIGISYYADNGHRDSKEEQEKYIWAGMGKWKYIVPSILLFLLFISNLVPKRDHFLFIIATPYILDSGKSIIESLQDSNSKLSKLNQITDKALTKAIEYLDSPESPKEK